MATEIIEDGFVVPLDVLKKSSGVAIDMGFSTIKIVYRPKAFAESDDANKLIPGKGILHMAMFEADRLKDVLEFIKSHCDFRCTEDTNGIHVCGRGYNKCAKETIEEQLDCQVIFETTEDVIGEGVRYLFKSRSREEVFHHIEAETIEIGLTESRMMGEIFDRKCPVVAPAPLDLRDCKPIVIADLGATFRFYKIGFEAEEPTCEYITDTDIGGRFFQAICGFFSDKKDFPSLRHLCETCNGYTVETTIEDYAKSMSTKEEESEDDFYTKIADAGKNTLLGQMRFFVMNKMVTGNREDAKMGDGVQSIMRTVCENGSYHIINAMETAQTDTVVMIGSWINSLELRNSTMKHIMISRTFREKDSPMVTEFMQNSSYVGALGAFLR